MFLHIETDDRTHACIVHLRGEIDLGNVEEVRVGLEHWIETGFDQVVLDLSEVTYVDSTVLGLLVWMDHLLAPSGGKVVLVGASRDVSRILELSGLVGVAPTLATRQTVEEALDGLAPASAAGALRWTESILLPAQVESLARVRSTVCRLLEKVELTETARFDIRVAVGEALANAVRHGSPGGEADQVRIDVTSFEDRVVIEVRDSGSGFDFETVADADDLYALGGRGVLFMKALMDDVSFSRDERSKGTVVRLEKRLRVREHETTEH